jgi:hypothetical protein
MVTLLCDASSHGLKVADPNQYLWITQDINGLRLMWILYFLNPRFKEGLCNPFLLIEEKHFSKRKHHSREEECDVM